MADAGSFGQEKSSFVVDYTEGLLSDDEAEELRSGSRGGRERRRRISLLSDTQLDM